MQKGFKREYPDLQEHLERLKKYDLLYTTIVSPFLDQ